MPIMEQLLYQTDKSSHRMCSMKKPVRKNFAIFTGTTCVEVSFGDEVEIKLQAVRCVTLLKRDSTQMFSCEYYKISNNSCFEEHLRTAASENDKKDVLEKPQITMIIT